MLNRTIPYPYNHIDVKSYFSNLFSVLVTFPPLREGERTLSVWIVHIARQGSTPWKPIAGHHKTQTGKTRCQS